MNGKIAIKLMYDGSCFHGWQVQPKCATVQQTVQDTLEKILGFRPDVTGCSRTDSGVHANEYVCHIDAENVNIPPDALTRALNSHFPPQIVSIGASLKDSDFHARYSCVGKEYIYKIWNAEYMNPFMQGKALYFPKYIDVEKYKEFEKDFTGTHDYRAFMAKGSKPMQSYVRTVNLFEAKREDNLVTLRVSADGFLYNMVRIMTGTYLKLVSGKIEGRDIKNIIESKDRSLAGETVMPDGLYLNKVFY